MLDVRRREFITLLGGAAAAWPLVARAQQLERVGTIIVLRPIAANDPDARPSATAFQQGMKELGWIEGRNLRIDWRWLGTSDVTRIRSYATEVVGIKPDVILAASTPVVAAVRAQTRTIPIVFVQVIDPIAAEFVASLARPGGNLTGITNFEFSMGGKWVEILKEVSPALARMCVIYSPRTAPYAGSLLNSVRIAAPSFRVDPIDTPVKDVAEIRRAIDEFAEVPNGGLLVLPDVTMVNNRDLIIGRAAHHRLPAIYPFRYFVASGGLMSYGIDTVDPFRRIAAYVDRILRGGKPEELPVQAPNKFELVINLKTAKVLGIAVPPMLLARADEVIE